MKSIESIEDLREICTLLSSAETIEAGGAAEYQKLHGINAKPIVNLFRNINKHQRELNEARNDVRKKVLPEKIEISSAVAKFLFDNYRVAIEKLIECGEFEAEDFSDPIPYVRITASPATIEEFKQENKIDSNSKLALNTLANYRLGFKDGKYSLTLGEVEVVNYYAGGRTSRYGAGAALTESRSVLNAGIDRTITQEALEQSLQAENFSNQLDSNKKGQTDKPHFHYIEGQWAERDRQRNGNEKFGSNR